MELSPQELAQLNPKSYLLLDLRSEAEQSYGVIPGALPVSAQALAANPPADKSRRLILVCRQGTESRRAAEALSSLGYQADSLQGGYNAWLVWTVEGQPEDDLCFRVENSLRKKFRKSIWSRFTQALKQYQLVNAGDKVAVCISGGKDSMLMAKLFQELKRYSKVPFEVEYIVMDPGYSPANRRIIEENCRRLQIPVRIFESDIFSSVYNVEKNPCYLCARMRRGHLYSFAKELGCNKIALGHHYDDVIETILMGMLYGAQIQTMMPKLHSTNFGGMELIRPLYLIREKDIKHWRDYNSLHFIQCACKFTEACSSCETEETLSKRLECKKLIAQLKTTNPDVEARIFRSVENVCLDSVIGWKTGGERFTFLDRYDSTP